MIADLNFQGSSDDDVEFLAFVAYELIRRIQSFLGIWDYDSEWFTELVLEVVAKSSVFEACSSGDSYAFTFSCYFELGEGSGLAFEKVVDLYAREVGYLVYECEAEVIDTFFVSDVLSF